MEATSYVGMEKTTAAQAGPCLGEALAKLQHILAEQGNYISRLCEICDVPAMPIAGQLNRAGDKQLDLADRLREQINELADLARLNSERIGHAIAVSEKLR